MCACGAGPEDACGVTVAEVSGRAAKSMKPEEVRDALRAVLHPGLSRNIVAAGFVRSILVDGPKVVVEFAPEPEEGEEPKPAKLYRVVNPEIAKVSEEKTLGVEGCLSIPGYVGEVERHAAVTVKGFNLQAKPVRVKAEGWLARIFQHEIDHLDGVLFIDRATKVWKTEREESEASNV